MRLKFRLFILFFLSINSFHSFAQCLTAPSFGPNAVIESFEGVPYSEYNHSVCPSCKTGETNLVPPFTFASGVTVTSPPFGFDETDLRIFDYTKGQFRKSLNHTSQVLESHIPDGRAYFGVDQEANHNATFTFPYSVHKVGFYAEATTEYWNKEIVLTVYDSLDNIIGTCTVYPTGLAGNWKNNFIGYYSAAGNIAKIKVAADFLILDKLTFEKECTSPVINSITPSISAPIAVNTPISVSVDVPGNDNDLAKLNWGDGTSNETLDKVSIQHRYTTPGLYTLTATAERCNKQVSKSFQYVVVYDPNAGFITGGGWINSPLNAYAANPTKVGKASFSFNSKYLKGATKPTGNMDFKFDAGNLTFQSLSQEWLIVSSGYKAQMKGKGTINGSGDFEFLLIVIDGKNQLPQGPDRLRIKIWDKKNNKIIYDNQVGASDDALANEAIGNGSIVIHLPGDGKSVGATKKLNIAVMPNPSSNYFTLVTSSNKNDALVLRVIDKSGKVIETQSGLHSHSTIKIGHNYRPGNYYVEVIQGKEKVTVQLNKTAH